MTSSRQWQIVVRTEGSADIGLGHLSRCAGVVSFLQRIGACRAMFLIGQASAEAARGVVGDLPGVSVAVLESGEMEAEVVQRICANDCHLMLVDSYEFSVDACRMLKHQLPTVPILAIDDGGEKRGYPVDGFLSFGLGADAGMYPEAKLSSSVVGPKFFPLRPDLARVAELGRTGAEKVRRLLITMGGSDPERQTARVARLARGVRGLEAVDVVLGPAFGPADDVREAVAGDPRFTIHRAPENYADLVAQADLAVSGAGTSAMELMACGVPTVLMTLADNQRATEAAVRRHRCGIAVGDCRRVSDDDIRDAVESLVRDDIARRGIVASGRRLVDGRGGERLARFLVNFMAGVHGDAYSEEAVRDEYEQASRSAAEHEKLKWGSSEGMLNRYRLALHAVDWSRVSTWLDVGCGTGAFLREAETSHCFDRFVGVDLSPSLLRFAAEKDYATPGRSFSCQSFMDPVDGAPFDLVTCIGVLQKCGVPLRKAVARLAELVRPGGTVFVTTKHRGWKRFGDEGFVPHPGHHWFALSEVLEAFAGAGLRVERVRGFEPRAELSECAPEESHSIAVLAVRESFR